MIDLKDYRWLLGRTVWCIKTFSGKSTNGKKMYEGIALPQKYKKYTVRDVLMSAGFVSIRLTEIRNFKMLFADGFLEPSFNLEFFKVTNLDKDEIDMNDAFESLFAGEK